MEFHSSGSIANLAYHTGVMLIERTQDGVEPIIGHSTSGDFPLFHNAADLQTIGGGFGKISIDGGTLGSGSVSGFTSGQHIIFLTAANTANAPTNVNLFAKIVNLGTDFIGGLNARELVVYSTNKLDDRSALETNLNNHYSVF